MIVRLTVNNLHIWIGWSGHWLRRVKNQEGKKTRKCTGGESDPGPSFKWIAAEKLYYFSGCTIQHRR
jgi:hypothetical protein